jgi:alpha-D-ribose 1-methylphosphonate 5-phosphate C-P lyase
MAGRSNQHYKFAFLDEGAKREIRRTILKAVAIPGYQVPFGSRELPIGRGWGTGGTTDYALPYRSEGCLESNRPGQ